MGTTPNLNLPYPEGTDPVSEGDDAIQALAEAIDSGISPSTLPPGVILPYGGATAPSGFLLCNGSAVSRADYPNLFEAIGTTFGAGDGSTTFNVPISGKFLFGADASRPLGAQGGNATIQVSHLPSHTHGNGSLNAGHDHDIRLSNSAGSGLGNVAMGTTSTNSTDGGPINGSNSPNVTGTTGATGGGNQFLPPYLSVTLIIKT